MCSSDLTYEAGFSPICPLLYLPLFLNDSVPEEHKAGIDMRRDMLRRSHTLIICGSVVDEDVKNDIAVAGRLGITATTLEGVLAVKGPGEMADADYGYVGAAPGRITLYKGRTVVEKNIPQEEALDRLALIKANGDWADPENQPERP